MTESRTEGQDFISAHHAARILGITAPTVYNWIRRGVLIVYRDTVSGQVLLDRNQVESLAPQHRIRREEPRDGEEEA